MRPRPRRIDSEAGAEIAQLAQRLALLAQLGTSAAERTDRVHEKEHVDEHQRVEEERDARRVPEQLGADAGQDDPEERLGAGPREPVDGTPLARDVLQPVQLGFDLFSAVPLDHRRVSISRALR